MNVLRIQEVVDLTFESIDDIVLEGLLATAQFLILLPQSCSVVPLELRYLLHQHITGKKSKKTFIHSLSIAKHAALVTC